MNNKFVRNIASLVLMVIAIILLTIARSNASDFFEFTRNKNGDLIEIDAESIYYLSENSEYFLVWVRITDTSKNVSCGLLAIKKFGGEYQIIKLVKNDKLVKNNEKPKEEDWKYIIPNSICDDIRSFMILTNG